jgi:chaperonin cofactor prefoldin
VAEARKGASESRRKSIADVHAAKLGHDGQLQQTMQQHEKTKKQLARELDEAKSALGE